MNNNNNNNSMQAPSMNESIQALAQTKVNNLTPILKEYAKEYANFQQEQQQFFTNGNNNNNNNNANMNMNN